MCIPPTQGIQIGIELGPQVHSAYTVKGQRFKVDDTSFEVFWILLCSACISML